MMVLENLSYSYSDKEIFKDFTWLVNKNIAIIHGPSGTGKTTLLKLVFGLYKPTSLKSMHNYKKIGLVLQEDSLLPWLTGVDNIIKFAGVSQKQIEEHQLFGIIKDFVQNRAYKMSYGQRRMIELFRILISDNDLILLDEPFNFINQENRKIFLEFLSRETRQFIISTHFDDGFALPNAETYKFVGKAPFYTLVKYENSTL